MQKSEPNPWMKRPALIKQMETSFCGRACGCAMLLAIVIATVQCPWNALH